jgi:hypothetical protein
MTRFARYAHAVACVLMLAGMVAAQDPPKTEADAKASKSAAQAQVTKSLDVRLSVGEYGTAVMEQWKDAKQLYNDWYWSGSSQEQEVLDWMWATGEAQLNGANDLWFWAENWMGTGDYDWTEGGKKYAAFDWTNAVTYYNLAGFDYYQGQLGYSGAYVQYTDVESTGSQMTTLLNAIKKRWEDENQDPPMMP